MDRINGGIVVVPRDEQRSGLHSEDRAPDRRRVEERGLIRRDGCEPSSQKYVLLGEKMSLNQNVARLRGGELQSSKSEAREQKQEVGVGGSAGCRQACTREVRERGGWSRARIA
jgi:hypothetical protein